MSNRKQTPPNRGNMPKRKPAGGKPVNKAVPKKAVKSSTKPVKQKRSKEAKASDRGAFNIRYLTKEGARNLWSNRLMSVASVAVLTSCLMLIGIAFMLFVNINAALKDVQDQNVIMVYIDENATEDDISAVGQDIRMTSDVESAEYVSKEEAFKKQLESMGEDAKLMEGLGENPLPNAYQVYLKSLDHYDTVLKNLESVEHVSSVRGNTDLANQVKKMRRSVTIVSSGIVIMLLAVSLFIIANTIRVTMYNRRLEISIMKAVGATNWFIRWPFIVEGAIIGVISGALAELCVYGIYTMTIKSVGNMFSILGGTVVPFSQYAYSMLLGFILIGVLAGVIGSIVSMSRYLKEQGSVIVNEEQ